LKKIKISKKKLQCIEKIYLTIYMLISFLSIVYIVLFSPNIEENPMPIVIIVAPFYIYMFFRFAFRSIL